MRDLADRIDLRRFVGREHLLWLWFESEILEGTTSTKAHGEFGLWVEGKLVLSAGREETRIRGKAPGRHREAKEALRRGKLPDLAGLHLAYGDKDATLVLKAESFALASVVLPTVLEEEEVERIDAPKKAPPRRGKRSKRDEDLEAAHAEHESFYERMRLAGEIEERLEVLYDDFLGLRLGRAWSELVVPALVTWTEGGAVDDEHYRRARQKALEARRRTGASRARRA